MFSVDNTQVIITDNIEAFSEEEVVILETHRSKPCFDQECSELANKRKQTKLLWLQNPDDQIADDLTNMRCDMWKKKRDYMKEKVNKLKKTLRTKIFGQCIRVLINSRSANKLALK